MSDELFKAILAMDAYNRGVDEGLVISANGDHFVGNATFASDTRNDQDTLQASFYAVAYNVGSGKTVMSYRGTDAELELPSDLPAWATGAGSDNTAQTRLAADFYRDVAGSTANPITLTGHSLGGGLAGFVGSIYGVDPPVEVENESCPLAIEDLTNRHLTLFPAAPKARGLPPSGPGRARCSG
ncbi:MAG: Mbeg1-like protein [Pseudomonadota bacterium]